MESIQFPYRHYSHRPLLLNIDASGGWENHGLDVEYDYYIGPDESHEKVGREVEFIGGTHLSPYWERVKGDDWIYVGQTVREIDYYVLFDPELDIQSLTDLKGKTIARRGRHPGLDDWLHLKQHGLDVDKGDIEFIDLENKTKLEAIEDGTADAALDKPPFDVFADRRGLGVIDGGMFPMVHGTTMSTTKPFIEENPDIVTSLLKGTMEGIAYFKNNRDDAISLIEAEYTVEDQELDTEAATAVYESFNKIVAPTLYPIPQAIVNVYEEAARRNEMTTQTEPFELWDFSFLRDIMDSGFADTL